LTKFDKIAISETEVQEKLIRRSEIAEQVVTKTENKVVETASSPRENAVSRANEGAEVYAARQEYAINGVRAVKAIGNEDPFKIAVDFNMDYSEVMIFNDLNTGERFTDGEYIYLQAKQSNAGEATCSAKPGESMRDIS